MKKIRDFLIEKYVAAECGARNFFKGEKGAANIVAVVLIVAVAVILAILFRRQITGLVTNIFTKIEPKVEEVLA